MQHTMENNGGAELAAAIMALAAAVRALAGCRRPEEASRRGGLGPMGLGPMGTWQECSVVELRALLRSLPVDRRSLPAPIEKLRRAQLVEALQQLEALGP